MASTVFANDDGFFHKGSGGSGKAYPDVCLSPPPPPAGPVPVPYPNSVSASDLADGSKSVKVEGNPTALEDKSLIATSTGDEGGTQGGNVLTHQTKGKGYFKMWSMDVKVEGKGVDRHGDPIGQNCASDPIGGMTPKSTVNFWEAAMPDEPCDEPYVAKEHRHSMVKAQYDKVAKAKACWQCSSPSPLGWRRAPPPAPGVPMKFNPKKVQFVPDHQPPSFVIWYMGGCQDDEDFKEKFQSPDAVEPHCKQCSDKQGGFSSLSKKLSWVHGHA